MRLRTIHPDETKAILRLIPARQESARDPNACDLARASRQIANPKPPPQQPSVRHIRLLRVPRDPIRLSRHRLPHLLLPQAVRLRYKRSCVLRPDTVRRQSRPLQTSVLCSTARRATQRAGDLRWEVERLGAVATLRTPMLSPIRAVCQAHAEVTAPTPAPVGVGRPRNEFRREACDS